LGEENASNEINSEKKQNRKGDRLHVNGVPELQ